MYRLALLLLAFLITATINPNSSSLAKNLTGGWTPPNQSTADETERFEKLYPFDANGQIEVSNINGSITIEAWDSPQIRLEYVKTASNRERFADVEVKIDAGQDSFRVETDYSNKSNRNWNGGKLQVEYRLTVPRTARLDRIKSVNGHINITGMSNLVSASAVNGNVLAKNLSGKLRISTVNGTVNAELDQIPAGSEVKLSTVNGTVNLYLPGYVDAEFTGSTLNGNITSDFGLTVTKRRYSSGSSLSGILGSGSSKVNLSSVNGTIAIKQGSNL